MQGPNNKGFTLTYFGMQAYVAYVLAINVWPAFIPHPFFYFYTCLWQNI